MMTLGAVRRVVDRLTRDARGDTAAEPEIREYARALLADLGAPLPPEGRYDEQGRWIRTDRPEPAERGDRDWFAMVKANPEIEKRDQ